MAKETEIREQGSMSLSTLQEKLWSLKDELKEGLLTECQEDDVRKEIQILKDTPTHLEK